MPIHGIAVPDTHAGYNALPWRDRAVLATVNTRFGMMLRSAMGIAADEPPSCGRPCITSDGYMIGNYVSRDGDSHMGAMLGAVADLETNIVGFPKHLGMTPAERQEFYAMWRKWIATDYRSQPGLRLDDGRTR